jgi:DNA-binding transcriptional ArsR family regulator
VDVFAALAEPTRRQILDALARSASSVNELVAALDVAQPTMSKHLRVLREAGFVSRRGSAQRRIYQLEPGSFRAIDRWLDRYRRLWTRHLDALERHLDAKESPDDESVSPRPRGRRERHPRR